MNWRPRCRTVNLVFTRFVAIALSLIWLSAPSRADTVTVAVAANVLTPAREVVAAFESATGHTVTVVSGATGTLYAQALNGAPFDLLLAADQARPAALVALGLVRAEDRQTYAIGRLVLWTRDDVPELRTSALQRLDARDRIAVANPKLAPYGRAAMQWLRRTGTSARVADRLVTAQNVNQALQFAATGNARFALISASLVYRDGQLQRGSAVRIPDALHEPIRQDMVLLGDAAQDPAARALFTYLAGPEARAILERFGYEVP